MAGNNTAKQVAELVKPYVEQLGLILWDVRFVKEGASWYLRIFIDKQGGVTIDDCTNVHHAIDPIIDEADPIRDSYYLEVCSPGLERELTRTEHFSKMQGENVKIKLYKARNGSKELGGKLVSFDGKELVVNVLGEEVVLEKADFSSCRLDDINF